MFVTKILSQSSDCEIKFSLYCQFCFSFFLDRKSTFSKSHLWLIMRKIVYQTDGTHSNGFLDQFGDLHDHLVSHKWSPNFVP